MKIINKILSIHMWVWAILVCICTYTYDKWQYKTMWQRCMDSDMADAEAYAFCNHHHGWEFLLPTIGIILLLWIIRWGLKKLVCKG